MDRLRAITFSAALAGTLLVSVSAEAYCQKSTCTPEEEECDFDSRGCVVSGYGVTWRDHVALPYAFTRSMPRGMPASAVKSAFRRAVRRWVNVRCKDGITSLLFEEKPELDAKPKSGKNAPSDFGIYFREDEWPGKAEALAITRLEKGLTSGKVTGASIQFNLGMHEFSLDGEDGTYDLEAVMVHEIGHYLGLDHSTAPGSVMAADYCNNEKPCSKTPEQLRELGDDDIAGVCALYPPAVSPDATIPVNNCQASPVGAGAAGTAGTVGTAVLGLAALARVRRRSRHARA